MRFLLLLLLIATSSTIATAQSIPDEVSPAWAAKQLDRMRQEGLLTGYTDTSFKGRQSLSRVEMATAFRKIYERATEKINVIESAVTKITLPISGQEPFDNDALRAHMAELQHQIGGLKPLGKEIAKLRILAIYFEHELTNQGIQVGDVKLGLMELEERVDALEPKKATRKDRRVNPLARLR